MFIKKKKGQSTLEYAIIIAVVIAGLIAMQFYIKRGQQGRLRSATDDMGKQFDPLNTTGSTTTNYSSNSTENIAGGTTNSVSDSSQNKNANETVSALNTDKW
jgi:uncharacterized protein (UPF0333 family)